MRGGAGRRGHFGVEAITACLGGGGGSRGSRVSGEKGIYVWRVCRVGQGHPVWGPRGLWGPHLGQGAGVGGYQGISVRITVLLLDIIGITTPILLIITNPATCFKHFTNKNSFHLFNNPLREVVAIIIIIIPILEEKNPKTEVK